MSVYALTVEQVAASGEGVPSPREAGDHDTIDGVLGALAEELVGATAAARAPDGPVALEARLETLGTGIDYKQLYGRLAPLHGEQVRLSFADGGRRRGELRTRVTAAARELLLDGEGFDWRALTLVERLFASGFAAHCEGPAAPAWALSGLLVLRLASPR